VAVGLFLCAAEGIAAVRMPKIFGNAMVLQREMAVPVWGSAKPGEKVTVSFAGQQKTATADAYGKWMVRLDAMPTSKSPRELIVAGENTVTFQNVLVGEVWLCGGQSNMELRVLSCLNLEAEKAAATNSAIRCIKITGQDGTLPMEDVVGQWVACSPDAVQTFTAAGYFFAREIAKELDVPVGLISDNWGGTRIEPWTPPEGFRAVPELAEINKLVDGWVLTSDAGRRSYAAYLASVKAWLPEAEAAFNVNRNPPPPPQPAGAPAGIGQPTRLYNGMIAPVVPYAIRGAIWYQGEANNGEGVTYFQKMKALIAGWRQLWGEGDFPFYYVQLANFQKSDPNNPAGGDGYATVREAQFQALSIPNTGMAVAIDLGEAGDIHPKNKQDVGKRLALWALSRDYGKKDLVVSGPLYKSFAVEGNKIRVSFDYVGGGLIVGEKNGLEPAKEVAGGKLKWFAIAGEDKVWHWADAVIDGRTVLVSCPEVAKPVAVRYAFAMNPEGANLYNKEGLPASPFRTDRPGGM